VTNASCHDVAGSSAQTTHRPDETEEDG
jgi:hypothetical protein